MKIFYPDNLPIVKHRQAIIEALRHHQVLVIAGDTGSGKTTQLPKMCLEAFPDSELLIGCTQPRRIAASTVAARVSEEMGDLSDTVGYKIRFHDHTTPSTKIKFMTDGVLLAETRQDRLLSGYGVLIIDEAHERNLNIDFLLGYIKQLLVRRSDLKVIITSATIDTEAFSSHFSKAPVITVSGRTYPVSVEYTPPHEDISGEKEGELDHCVATVCNLFSNAPKGDVLVFLPTEREIRECCKLLEIKIPSAVVLPMFGRLPAADQKRIFQRAGKIKIVVATNVAETSVTVPGIRYVVDNGLARISYYNVRAKTTSLPISRISRASCDQRKGRCGRVGPGHCIRLYTEEDFNDRPQYTVPELKRSNLAEVILQMISLGLGEPENFPFIDPPHGSAIREGYRLLKELGAIDDKNRLTKRGHMMADLPIDPCISRIILEAKENNCLREIKIISAVLAIQDPRIRPADKEKEAETAHKIFSHPHSDFMVLLNIWNMFHSDLEGSKSWSKLKKYCKTHFLSFQRMREWFDLHDQLGRIIRKRKGFTDNLSEPSYEQIHKSFLAGFVRNVATKKQGRLYQGAGNKELMIFPGSHQFLKGGQWLLAASFIETSRLYALTVATIESEWIEAVAGQLCKYTWTNPRWNKKSGQVIADETVSLFGLIIATGRQVNFGQSSKKNSNEARDIFIQSALVTGELKGSYLFLEKNLALIKKWQEAEEKLRSRNIVVDDLALYQYYAGKIPPGVYDQRSLNRCLKKKRNQSFLVMTEEDVLRRRPEENELVDFPPTLSIGKVQIRLEYHFEPGSDNDGVTFRLPLDLSTALNSRIFDWLVPGLLHEKLTYLLKALPKGVRKKLVPVGDTVNRLLDDMDFGSGSLFAALESSILKHFKLLVRRTEWTDALPPHLLPRFLLFDGAGNEVCSGRNLKELLASQGGREQAPKQASLRQKDQEIVKQWENTEHTTWSFAGLPPSIPAYTQHGEVTGFLYATLAARPEKGCVRIVFSKNEQTAKKTNRKGLLYLYRLQFNDQYKALKKICSVSFSGPSAISLIEMGRSRKELIDELLEFILASIFGPIPEGILHEKTYREKIAEVKKIGLFRTGQKMCQDFMALLRTRRTVQESIRKIFKKNTRKNHILPDMEKEFIAHLSEIFPGDLLLANTPTSFQDIDRQLQSLSIRLERFNANPGKDKQKAEQLAPYTRNLKDLMERKDDYSEEGVAFLFLYHNMVNEYRISLFSPEIRTRIPVSQKKLDQLWRETLSKC
jgi:ATP-dependent helicase HrpA